MKTFSITRYLVLGFVLFGRSLASKKVIRCHSSNSAFSDQLCSYNEVAVIVRVYVGYSNNTHCMTSDEQCIMELNNYTFSNVYNDVIDRCPIASACMSSLYTSSVPIMCNNERKQSNFEVIEYKCVSPVYLQYKTQCLGRPFTEPLCKEGQHAIVYKTYLGRGGGHCGSPTEPICVYLSNDVVDQDIRNKCSGRRSCRDLLVSSAWITCQQNTVNATFVVIQYTCEGQADVETMLPPTEYDATSSSPDGRISEDAKQIIYVVVPVIMLLLTIAVSIFAAITWHRHRKTNPGGLSVDDSSKRHLQVDGKNSDLDTRVTSDYVIVQDNRYSSIHDDYIYENKIYVGHIAGNEDLGGTDGQNQGHASRPDLGHTACDDDLLIEDNPNYASALPVRVNDLLPGQGPSQNDHVEKQHDNIYCEVNIDDDVTSSSDAAPNFKIEQYPEGTTGYSKAKEINSLDGAYSNVQLI